MTYKNTFMTVAVLTGAILTTGAAAAQDYAPGPLLAPQQLDTLVGGIALYPDPLLAQVLAAATFTDQIPDAAQWASDHRFLRGDALADAIEGAQLPWDPSVQALLPFPDLLDMMARDMGWTSALGTAVLMQRPDVMDAVQRMRRQALAYGYLRSNGQIRVVETGGWTEIVPYDPAVIYVPVYDPYVVYAPPRPGIFIGTGIRFGPAFTIGVFGRWGWGGAFDWHRHTVFVNHVVWGRNWQNRTVYVHNWNNWNGGHWRPAPVQRELVVHRDVVRDRGDQHTFRPPAAASAPVRSQGFRNDQNRPAPPVRREEVRRPPAPAPQPNPGFERRSAPEHKPESNRTASRGDEKGRR